MSFPKYARYKDSGVEWLGEVPEHWELTRLKHLARFAGGGTPSRDVREFWNGDIPWVSPKDMKSEAISGSEEQITTSGLESGASSMIPEGRLLMVTRSGILRHTIPVAVNAIPVALNQDMKALSFRDGPLSSTFFLRWVQGLNNQLLLAWGKQGATVESIEHEYLANTRIAWPDGAERMVIVTFLDRETAKIDALIAEQQRLIELLKEKRQAVISHAVTRGLNPDAPMKPSGVEWLGDVPAHWTLCLLKRVFRTIDYGISDSLAPTGAVAVLRMGNIAEGRIKADDLKYVDAVDSALLLSPGDLLYNRTNSLDQIAKVGLYEGGADTPVSFASYLVRLRTRDEVLPEFMMYFLNTSGMLGVARASAFVAIGQCNLNPSRYGEIPVAIPPRNEQKAIVQFLKEETHRINRLIEDAKSTIVLLQERRTALISAAVTGKIDVRGIAMAEAA